MNQQQQQHTLQTSEDVTATSGEWNEAKLNEASLQQLFDVS